MAKIVLYSKSFDDKDLINVRFKNYIISKNLNDSPDLRWTIDVDKKYIKSFSIYCECLDLNSQRSYAPNQNFLLWAVKNISPKQLLEDNVFGIYENGYWVNSDVEVLKTDYEYGDRTNGWNGPSCDIGKYNYRIWVEAFVKNDTVSKEVVGVAAFRSNYIYFYDTENNIKEQYETSQCNKLVCPTGYTYNSEIGKCEKIEYSSPKEGRNTIDIISYNTSEFENDDIYIWDTKEEEVTIRVENGVPIMNKLYDFESFKLHHADRLYISNYGGINDDSKVGKYIFDSSKGLSEDFFEDKEEYVIFVILKSLQSNAYKFNLTLCGTTIDFTAIQQNADKSSKGIINGYTFVYHKGASLEIEWTKESEDYNNTSYPIFYIHKKNQSYLKYNTLQVIEGTTLAYNIFKSNGLTCTLGTYDSNTGMCKLVDSLEPTKLACFYTIESCDGTRNYKIIPNEGFILEVGYVYTFNGGSEFFDKETNNPYGFIVTSLNINEDATGVIKDVDIIEKLGPSTNPNVCKQPNGNHKFVACDSEHSDVITTLNHTSMIPQEGGVYNMSFCEYTGEFDHYQFDNEQYTKEYKKNCECYHYDGITTEERTHTNLFVKNDYDSENCGICNGCYKFKACLTGEYIVVSLIANQSLDDTNIGNIYQLKGFDYIEGIAWKYYGKEDCKDSVVNYDGVEVLDIYDGCTDCNIAYPVYEITNCSDDTDVKHIVYVGEEKLDQNCIYVFKEFAFCYSIRRIPSQCEISDDDYVISEYREKYDTCKECNKTCVYIEKCSDGTIIKPSNQTEFMQYNGKFLKYKIVGYDEEYCGVVMSYRCGSMDLEELDVEYVDGCFSTCSECSATVEESKNFEMKHRHIQPNIEPYTCCDTPSNNECECKPKTECCGQYVITYKNN